MGTAASSQATLWMISEKFSWDFLSAGVLQVKPINNIMKSTALPRLAALLCSVASLQAQEHHTPSAVSLPVADSAASAPANRATRMPNGVMLERMKFEDLSLQQLVAFLESEQERHGGESLNVVLAPMVGELKVPSLSLRKVTTTEVLAICGNLLGLKVESVPGEFGSRHAALIVKPSDAVLAPASGAEMGQGGSGGLGAAPGSVITLASSVKPGPQCRVFSMAALLPTGSGDARKIRQKMLFDNLYSLARDQDASAQLQMYADLELVRVTSTAMPLIEQAFEAMRADVGRKAGDGVPAEVARELERVRKEAQELKSQYEARERGMRETIEKMSAEIKTLRAAAMEKQVQ